ncbi:MAG: ribonuclease E/G [Alphaproteobacteria bacterium]|nr:ribonuclease E/G [Alphaproteobacteria bacterium]MCB1550927.1 ribonuclease E/G [Alphaproteobacteria bacterium]MCB9984350.1 ribonuclease E/G [Micavibrio sp.]HRK97884.1 ribonuclease E/G [Alphaproteobacteria bacterium]
MDIIIEEQDSCLWVAATERHKIEGLEVDPPHELVRWGSVFWARVDRIDARMDAAFLDLDGDVTGILYNRDIRSKDNDGKLVKGGQTPIGKLISPGQYLLVQAKQGYLEPEFEDDVPYEDKCPVVSMDVSIQGRYLIYTPLDDSNRISSRIRDKKLRKQLTDMLAQMDDVHGCILRAAALNTQSDVLIRESKILKAIWEGLTEYAKGEDSILIMEGPDALQRSLSDNSLRPIRRIEVVTMDHFATAEDWCELFAPDLVTKIKPIEVKNATKDLALLDHYDLIKPIEDLFQPYALLISGGNILIQGTAALTAIDVNRGADKNANLTINLEAATEAIRQIRIRNLGGIIMIDFLRMKSDKEQKQLLSHIEKLVDDDPCTVQIHGFTAMGLLEVSRQRRTPTLLERVGYMFEEV